MRLLLVEDVTSLADTARRLRRYGYLVVAASSRLEAAAVSGRFDCLVVDPELADGDGVELARRLLGAGRCERVVFYPKREASVLRARCEELGAFVPRDRGVAELASAVSPRRKRLSSGVDALSVDDATSRVSDAMSVSSRRAR